MKPLGTRKTNGKLHGDRCRVCVPILDRDARRLIGRGITHEMHTKRTGRAREPAPVDLTHPARGHECGCWECAREMAALLALHPDEPEYHCHCDACWENWTTNDHLLLSRPLTAPIAAFARAA